MTNPSTRPLRVRAERGFIVIGGPGGVIAPLLTAAAIPYGEAPHAGGALAVRQIGADLAIGRTRD